MTNPNVPSCGCKIENYLAFNDTGIPEHYRSERIKYCELHASAKEMLEAIEHTIRYLQAKRGGMEALLQDHLARVVVTATGEPLDSTISRAEKGDKC